MPSNTTRYNDYGCNLDASREYINGEGSDWLAEMFMEPKWEWLVDSFDTFPTWGDFRRSWTPKQEEQIESMGRLVKAHDPKTAHYSGATFTGLLNNALIKARRRKNQF